ncbi:MAG: hypothetical protein QM754_00625 [Tepidisphaeraceae bacterium]
MHGTRTYLLCSASVASASAAPAISAEFAEQWLRIASLSVGIIASLLLSYLAVRRERRLDREADERSADRLRDLGAINRNERRIGGPEMNPHDDEPFVTG